MVVFTVKYYGTFPSRHSTRATTLRVFHRENPGKQRGKRRRYEQLVFHCENQRRRQSPPYNLKLSQ